MTTRENKANNEAFQVVSGATGSPAIPRLGCDAKTVDNALQRVKRKVGTHLSARAVMN